MTVLNINYKVAVTTSKAARKVSEQLVERYAQIGAEAIKAAMEADLGKQAVHLKSAYEYGIVHFSKGFAARVLRRSGKVISMIREVG